MILLMRQTSVLMRKDIMLMFNPKSAFTTIVRALLLPVILALYMSVIIKVYWPKENYGVGTPHQLLSLPGAMQLAKGGRDTLVFVNGIASGGEIDRVIALIAESIKSSGKNVIILDKEVDLLPTCPSTLQGTTKCFGAVVFNSSPKEGAKGIWNYTLRADASFGVNVDVLKTNNDPDIYQLPLQRAVDAAIAAINTTGDAVPLPRIVNEYRKYRLISI
jgi:ATP-binding cassette subfamily A (ABC1) protein 3